jgi:hypothetical protein
LTNISPVIKSNAGKYSISTNKDILFVLIDKNPNYDFFFRAEKEEVGDRETILLTFTCKPFSEIYKEAKSTRLSLADFNKKLIEWTDNIEKYKTEKLIDDPIEKQYQEEFYKDFKIVDEDAETSRFNFSQQMLLLAYVENLEKYIAEQHVEFTIQDKEELLQETVILKQDIATESKDSYIKKQSGFWAKIRKKSIKACEFALKEFAKEVIKNTAEKGVTISWDSLPHYIEHLKNLLN